MGSGESTTRKVSFGVDDEDRVRILRGIKLSEDVLQRMRGVANIAPEHPSVTSVNQRDKDPSKSFSSNTQSQKSTQYQARPSTQSNTNKPTSCAEEERRHVYQQTTPKEELSKVAQREHEAMREITETTTRERRQIRQEADEAKQLAQQLHKKDSQLRLLDAFYTEQLALLEEKNKERYELSKEQFHKAVSKMEENVRSRSTDPVCLGLQSKILSCYRENRNETLKCSDLAKEYMQCINAAKKNLLHG
ncbi:MICOS complex subunit mic25a-like [Antennarius striatus]|uniref:MICOS complex subunit mic25a-like n=1 Tax=Antennarius striatus TaxID=241820 RepID=UPI0035B245BD